MTSEMPKAAEKVTVNVVDNLAPTGRADVTVRVQPTQVRRPWRSVTRTVFQALVALAVMAPILVQATGLDPSSLPWLAGVLAVCAAVTRVMALPQVEAFLRRFLPFLSAAPKG